jgi:hypothetical protein
MKTVTPAAQLAKLLANYAPEIARAFTAARRKMRSFVPRGYELVFENYSALGVGYGPGQKAPDVILSIVAYPRWITLFFLNGAHLQDPSSVLEGKGSRVRSIRLESPNDLDRPDIQQLISHALHPHAEALARCPRLTLVIRSIAAKRRPRRPGGADASKPTTKTSSPGRRGNHA